MKSFIVTLGQMRCDMESVERNEEKIVSWLAEAEAAGSGLLVLPELSLTGYRSFDAFDVSHEIWAGIERSLAGLREETRRAKVDLLVGYPLRTEQGVHIVSEYVRGGETVARHKKVNLCNYAHYTEHLHFIPGDDVTCAEARSANFGVIVCEDSWHLMNAIVAVQQGAEVLLNPSAASVTDAADVAVCLDNWMRIGAGTAFSLTSYYILCNQAGPTADGIYMGGSYVVDPAGRLVAPPMPVEEGIAHIPLDGGLLAETRVKRPLIANERMCVYAKYF